MYKNFKFILLISDTECKIAQLKRILCKNISTFTIMQNMV